MNLLVNALKNAIAELARAKGIAHPVVLDKRNARGQTVIALILPADDGPPTPKPRTQRQER